LILREDQREWQDAVKSEDIRRQKEERKLAKGVLDGWDNPDVSSHFWFEILAYDLVVA
jgi:RNA-binding protein NOB1